MQTSAAAGDVMPSTGHARLAAFLHEAGVGEDGMPPEIGAQISAGMGKKFDNPPAALLEVALGRRVPEEKVSGNDIPPCIHAMQHG